tara:strand:+ start:38 stop:487 length:450 start_codon:yes stop_codon:yes gene_type:complete
MAISRGSGTEIIRSVHLEDVTDTATPLIVGVQHHIYTVLSVIVFNNTIAATGTNVMYLQGYDSYGGTTDQSMYFFIQDTGEANETFVWNDKFSFNGFEPVSFTGPMNTAAEQDAIADQGSSVKQILNIYTSSNSNKIDVHCTFIDQNNE